MLFLTDGSKIEQLMKNLKVPEVMTENFSEVFNYEIYSDEAYDVELKI